MSLDNSNDTFQSIISIGAILSSIGSGAIIINTILSNNFFGKNNIWNRIIFFMSLCDLCASIDLLFGKQGDCKIQGLTIQFFFISSILWTAAIAFNIFFIVILNKELCEIERYEYGYHIIVWGLSMIFTFPLYFIDKSNNNTVMGDAGFWCWITSSSGKLRMIFFFGPLWAVFFINAFVYISMICIVNKRKKDASPAYVENSIAKRSNLFLLVFFLIWIWGTINRIQNIIDENNPKFILNLLHAIFTPLQGFFNSIVYFWYTAIEHFIALRKVFKKEEDRIKEIRRRRSNKENNNNQRSAFRCSTHDRYDNYFVYNPQPSHHHRNKKHKINDNNNNNDNEIDNEININHHHNNCSDSHCNTIDYNDNNIPSTSNTTNNDHIRNSLERRDTNSSHHSVITINSISSMLSKNESNNHSKV